VADPGVILQAELHGLVGREAELEALLAELAAASREEPGCAAFRVLRAEEPGELVVLSSFADERALRAHYRTAHFRRYRDRVGPLLARPSDVRLHRVSATIHARDPDPPDPGLFG
jgi:quinol monooxygenase YgiN